MLTHLFTLLDGEIGNVHLHSWKLGNVNLILVSRDLLARTEKEGVH